MVKTATALLSALLTAASCEKTDPAKARPEPVEVPAPRMEAPVPSKASSASPSVERPAEPCVFPLPAEPPKATNAASCPKDPQGNYALPHGKVTFVDTPGKPEVDVELARKPEHRERGLMYRTSLGSDAGMLFSWEDQAERVFWMKNTCLALDMLFLDKDGIIVGVVEQVTTLNQAPRTVPCKATHVLEVNAGWTRSHGVRPGQRVQIDS